MKPELGLSTSAVQRVRALAGSGVQVIVDDRALNRRAIEMLADILVRRDGIEVPAASGVRLPPSNGRQGHRRVQRAAARGK